MEKRSKISEKFKKLPFKLLVLSVLLNSCDGPTSKKAPHVLDPKSKNIPVAVEKAIYPTKLILNPVEKDLVPISEAIDKTLNPKEKDTLVVAKVVDTIPNIEEIGIMPDPLLSILSDYEKNGGTGLTYDKLQKLFERSYDEYIKDPTEDLIFYLEGEIKKLELTEEEKEWIRTAFENNPICFSD